MPRRRDLKTRADDKRWLVRPLFGVNQQASQERQPLDHGTITPIIARMKRT